MFFRNRLRRRPQPPVAAQALEARALLAATAGFDGQTLTIRGTDAHERVSIGPGGSPSLTSVVSDGRVILQVPTQRIQHIKALMRGGNDTLAVDLKDRDVATVTIHMGLGQFESVSLSRGRVGTLTMTGQATDVHRVDLRQVSVGQQANLSFANLTSRDSVSWREGRVNRLNAQLGGGNDRLALQQVTVSGATVDMGEGDDTLMLNGSFVTSGQLQGGLGADLFVVSGGHSGAAFDGFERAWI